MTDVVAALIWDGNRFLACQRPAHKARGLLWEFVGGKVEPGESKEEALIRECREELAVTVCPSSVFMELIHEYPDLTVRLTLFNAKIVHGEPQLLEHNAIRWITSSEIPCYSFCPADVEILSKLSTIENGLQAELLSLSETDYRDFQCSLMPTVPKNTVLGVRAPALRKIANRMVREGEYTRFLESLPHRFHEENYIHAIVINGMKDPLHALEQFLPHVDNWAICDAIGPKSFKNDNAELLLRVRHWLQSDHPYTVRFAMGVLMRFFLEERFSPEHLHWVCQSITDAYYVRMMASWYYATALDKQYRQTVSFLERQVLPKWVHNKTIQKALESFRIPTDHKTYLRKLRMK